MWEKRVEPNSGTAHVAKCFPPLYTVVLEIAAELYCSALYTLKTCATASGVVVV